MFSKDYSKKVRFLFITLCSLLILALAGSSASAAPVCKKISGKFTLQPVTGAACGSALGICASGTYGGDIKGTNFLTGTSLTQTIDTPATGVVLLTGDNHFFTKDGELLTKDAIVLKTTGAGEFSEVDTIIGGTGIWAGVAGTFQAIGNFDLTNGGGGQYTGEVCSP